MAESARLVAAGLGSGLLPKAPGTWGSLAALIAAWIIVATAGIDGLIIAFLVVLILGCISCRSVMADAHDPDPAWIVVDEWLGQWLCLLLAAGTLPLTLPWLLAALAAFRFFDIAKPWPVSWAERLRPTWWAVVADDLVAGAMAGGVLLAIGVLV